MKEIYTIDENIYVLFDLLLHFIRFKDYPSDIKKQVEVLNKLVLEHLKDYEGPGKYDIVDIQRYLVETTNDGKRNRLKIDWDCYMLDYFLENYFDNKIEVYPENVVKKIEELKEEVRKNLPSSSEYLKEDSDITIEQEIEFEEPNF